MSARHCLPRCVAWVLCVALAAPYAAAQSDEATPAAPQEADSDAGRAPVAPLGESLTGMAKADYAAGRILYEDGDYAGSALKFKEAYEGSGDARLLWNIAAAQKNLRKYAHAYQLVQRYLTEGAVLLTEQDRQDATALQEALRPFLNELTLTVSQPGASVFVDGANVGASPLPAPLLVDMGVREIRVTKSGYKEFVHKENVSGGGKSSLTVSLVEESHEGTLSVAAGPGEAIRVDGKLVGVGGWQGALREGVHKVQVTAEGKLPYESEVLIRAEERSSVSVQLNPVPTSSSSSWLWVGSGVILAAAAVGIGSYFLLRPGEQEAPPPVPGTMAPGTIQLPFMH